MQHFNARCFSPSVVPPRGRCFPPSVPPRGSDRDRGAILIIAIGILTLLAVLGTTFVNLMRLEKQATQNYIDSQEVDLINDSALDAAIAHLRGADNWRAFTPYQSIWLYKVVKGDDVGELAAGVLHSIESDRVRSAFWSGSASFEGARDPHEGWDVLASTKTRTTRYKVKVIDTSAQINLNGKQDSLGRMLDNLAHAIKSSTRLHQPRYPLYEGYPERGSMIRGEQIIKFRNKLEGNHFTSKNQLRELIGFENFEIIKDFITVQSYEDPFTYKADDGINEIVDIGGLSGTAGLGGTGGQITMNPVENPSARISPEPRYPVNINTAPEEVLIACIRGIGCRRPFLYSRIAKTNIDESATIGGTRIPGKEERDSIGSAGMAPRGVWIYSEMTGQGFDYEKAKLIAQRIISVRKNTAFVTWSISEGRSEGGGGFQEFINKLQDSFFPAPEQCLVIDPNMPLDRRIDADIRGNGIPEMTRMWVRGNDQQEKMFREQAGLPFQTKNAFYFEMIKAALVANFNPNSRISSYNPNSPAFLPIDKSMLVRLDKDRRTPRKGHTTEFCFDTNGIYEITTLGQIVEGENFQPVYQKPMRTIVKVFDVMRHTNQFHFEKTFNSGEHSSRNNRRYVLTYPDPMVALTDALSHGSIRDGSIQLASMNDGRRLLAPASSRFQLFRSPETIVMAHGFQDRDDASYAQIQRLNRQGASTQWMDEVLKVLNASYSKNGKRFRDIYTRTELSQFGFTNARQLNLPPWVDTEQMGTDLYPDGFHQSNWTTSNVGGRFVHLPAHERIGQSSKSGLGQQVGAGHRKDLNGNIPYYDGGLAFWVKFEFNGDDPVFCGLVGFTQVIEDVGQTPKDSEGTQMYIFKNTEGYLRIVRMNYHQAFPDLASGEDGGGDATGINLWPPVDTSGGEGGAEAQIEIDPKKIVARADFIADIRKFRAHEWHHIAVDWNDTVPGSALQVYVDFERVEGTPFIPQAEMSDTPTAWVRLNCRRPRDELYIGGFIRSQGAADSGIFKWFTNTASTTTTGASGVMTVDPPLKRILANATIDEFITYMGSFPSVRNYYGSGAPGYFTNQPGDYANVFEVPLPPEVDTIILRSFDWTVYYPSFFSTREGQPYKINCNRISAQVFLGRGNIPSFNEPWYGNRRGVENPVANRPLLRRESKGQIGKNADLVYQFKIFPGKIVAGSLAGGSVQTPVIDDVTLTYFLPEPKILLQEEED